MGEMKKLKAKLLLWRILKVIFYIAGIPLLHYFVRLSVGEYSNVYTTNAKIILLYLNIAWAAIALIQIIMAFVIKSKATKGVIAALLAVIVAVAPIVYCETIIKGKYNEKRDALIEEGYSVDSYENALLLVNSYSSDYAANIDAFLEYYNIEYSSQNKGKNTDDTEVVYNEEDDAYYSMNGLFSDGYVFGYKQAKRILTTYHTLITENPDIDSELDAAIADLQKVGSAWDRYKRGLGNDFVKNSSEYEDAYGVNGTAKDFYVTEERLNLILKALGAEISESNLTGLIQLLNSFVPGIGVIANPELNIDMLMPVLEGFGLTKAQLFGLLETYSFYQSPTTYPIFHFIENEDLREYAYCRYYGNVHGKNIGSVLIPDVTVTVDEGGETSYSYSNVGEITFTETGKPYQDSKTVLDNFSKIDLSKELIEFYPYMIGRNWFYIFSGVVALSFIGAYFFASLEKRQFDRLTIKEGK